MLERLISLLRGELQAEAAERRLALQPRRDGGAERHGLVGRRQHELARVQHEGLAAVDLDRRTNIYIANIVKCRPPQNRDPLPEESAACMPWLRQQFQLIRPKIVVCLGRVAAQRMLDPGFSISRDHGKFFDKQGTLFMATYHPAALLRYPDNKPAVFGDFVALRQKITEVCEHTY